MSEDKKKGEGIPVEKVEKRVKLSSLALPKKTAQNAAGVEDGREEVSVGKPPKKKYIRVRPGEEWWTVLPLINYDGELYLIADEQAQKELEDEINAYVIKVWVTQHGSKGLWAIRVLGEDEKNDWITSALKCCGEAEEGWVKPVNKGNQWVPRHAKSLTVEPEWPEEDLEELVNQAFDEEHLVDHINHSFVKLQLGIDQ